MKRIIIAVVLTVVLVAGGLGGFVYAQNSVNQVHIGFATHYRYNVPEDVFTNQQVTGEKSWGTSLNNWEDTSAQPVNGVTLTLQSDWEFDYMNPAPDPADPPTWSFGTVDQESRVGVGVGSISDFFTPGFDASRSVVDNNTVFLQSEGTQTQTVDITVTPQLVEEPSMFDIHVDTGDYPLVNALISSVSTSEAYDTQVSWDERHAHIVVMDPDFGNTFTATVEIQVTPNVPKVEFIPYVEIGRSPFTPLYTTTDNLIVLTTEIGTWTWNAVGDYEWLVHEWEVIGCSLTWQALYRQIHEPMKGEKLVGQGSYAEWSYPGETDVNHLSTGFIVTNPDCVSEITIDRISIFAFDGTVVYEGPLRVKVNDHWEVYTGPLKPHEIVGTDLKYYDLPELTREVEMQYTVEIFWTWTDEEGLPLTGWTASFTVVRDAETDEAIEIIMWGATQMVNMEQELEPEDAEPDDEDED